MNRDVLEGKWKQLRGKVKEQWGNLTDDDLDQSQGRFDTLVGRIQERYGYARERAEQELSRFLERVPDSADVAELRRDPSQSGERRP
jgi:uncharacterized protein YjbJ (UPF0337 family)